MNTQITQKQKAFIIKLDATQKEETLNDLTVKEASYLIKSLLKGNTTEAQNGFKPCIDYEALKIKYNVGYKLGKDGQYNNNNGSNCHSPLLQDSRKFKSFINNVFKTEFKGVDISSKVSFAYNCYDNVEITIRAPKKELYSSYTLLSSQGRSALCRYTRTELTNVATAALYDRVIKNSEEQRNAAFLSDKYLKLYNFITDLLSSYSYNHSDIMTDYFDSGLSFVIYFEATDREEINNESRVYDMNSDEIIKQFDFADEVSEEDKKEAQARADKIEKEIEERKKQQEEENKKREELARIAKLKNKEINERIEQEELKEEDYYFIKGYFSNFNKACSIDEVNEYINDPKIGLEDINGTYCQIVKVINFGNKEDYDYFTNHFMSDWDFIAGVGGCAYINTETMEDLGYTEDLYRMPESERTVKNIGWARSCALIKLNGENKLLIDPEGFNYCRYVGIIA